jgi:hypothetical protein
VICEPSCEIVCPPQSNRNPRWRQRDVALANRKSLPNKQCAETWNPPRDARFHRGRATGDR